MVRSVVGSNELNATDSAVISDDEGLTTSLKADDAASDSEEEGADVARSTVGSPVETAINGNWAAQPGSVRHRRRVRSRRRHAQPRRQLDFCDVPAAPVAERPMTPGLSTSHEHAGR